MRPIILTHGGTDSLGFSGLHTDVRTVAALGGWCVSVVTAVTAQNSTSVRRVEPVGRDDQHAQLDAILAEVRPMAIKTGLLPDPASVDVALDALDRLPQTPLIVDPVGMATVGTALAGDAARRVLAQRLVPRATLLVPNAMEAAELTGLPVAGVDEAIAAAQQLRRQGAAAVLVTGGHFDGADRACDVLVDADGATVFRGAPIATAGTRGSGCCLASALATLLAAPAGDRPTLRQAVEAARAYVRRAIEAAVKPAPGEGAVDPLHDLRRTERALPSGEPT